MLAYLMPDQALMEVYSKLVKCEEAMPVAANEVYLRTWRGRWCFLPAIPGLCGASGPASPHAHTHTPMLRSPSKLFSEQSMGMLYGLADEQ